MSSFDLDQKNLFNVGNILEKEMHFQIASQKSIDSLEIELFDLMKEIEEKKYSLNRVETYIDNTEKDLKQEIIDFKTNYGLKLLDIQSKVQMTQKMKEIAEKKILDMVEIRQLNLLTLKSLKNRLIELQEKEITKNQYSIQLEQENYEFYNQERLNNKIERAKEKIKAFTSIIKQTEEEINETKRKTKEINEEINDFQNKKQSFSNYINKLSKKIEKQNKVKIQQNFESIDLSQYNDKISKLRELQMSYLSNVSKLFSKKLVIDSQYSSIIQKIETYRTNPPNPTISNDAEQYRNENFIKMNQNFLNRTELISKRIQNLFNTYNNDIKLMEKEKRIIQNELAIAKNQLLHTKQAEINIINHLNKIKKSIKDTIKSTNKMGKLMDYYDEYSLDAPNSFSFSKRELDKIKNPAYKLAQIHINTETEIIHQIKKCKDESKLLTSQISKQEIINLNLKKKIEEIQRMKSK